MIDTVTSQAESEIVARPSLDDDTLLRRFVEANDGDALEALFRRHADAAYATALRICRTLLAEFPLVRVAVTVQKPNPPIANFLGRVSVTLERDRAALDAPDAGAPA